MVRSEILSNRTRSLGSSLKGLASQEGTVPPLTEVVYDRCPVRICTQTDAYFRPYLTEPRRPLLVARSILRRDLGPVDSAATQIPCYGNQLLCAEGGLADPSTHSVGVGSWEERFAIFHTFDGSTEHLLEAISSSAAVRPKLPPLKSQSVPLPDQCSYP